MGKTYSEERYDPNLAHCTNLALEFGGRVLRMTGGKELYESPAASGRPDQDGRFSYAKDSQVAANTGPIPEGEYWIRPDELWERSPISDLYILVQRGWSELRAHREGWGDFRISIHPFLTTVTYGRGGFFIHGGKNLGSKGCIDLTQNMVAFALALRRETALRKCQIHLKVGYAGGQ